MLPRGKKWLPPKKKVNTTKKDSKPKKKVRIEEKREECLDQEKVEETGVVSEVILVLVFA